MKEKNHHVKWNKTRHSQTPYHAFINGLNGETEGERVRVSKLVDCHINAPSVDVHGKYNTSDCVATNKISMGFPFFRIQNIPK